MEKVADTLKKVFEVVLTLFVWLIKVALGLIVFGAIGVPVGLLAFLLFNPVVAVIAVIAVGLIALGTVVADYV